MLDSEMFNWPSLTSIELKSSPLSGTVGILRRKLTCVDRYLKVLESDVAIRTSMACLENAEPETLKRVRFVLDPSTTIEYLKKPSTLHIRHAYRLTHDPIPVWLTTQSRQHLLP